MNDDSGRVKLTAYPLSEKIRIQLQKQLPESDRPATLTALSDYTHQLTTVDSLDLTFEQAFFITLELLPLLQKAMGSQYPDDKPNWAKDLDLTP